jgi:integrase
LRQRVYPPRGGEVRALDELRRQFPDSAFVFTTECAGPLTADAINRHVKRIGWLAGLPAVHAHMLPHACGHALANAGQDTREFGIGSDKSIQHTPYTQLGAPRRSKTSGNNERGLEKLAWKGQRDRRAWASTPQDDRSSEPVDFLRKAQRRGA